MVENSRAYVPQGQLLMVIVSDFELLKNAIYIYLKEQEMIN
jgi:hypothetical protein